MTKMVAQRSWWIGAVALLLVMLSGCGETEEDPLLDTGGSPEERVARFEAARQKDPRNTEILSHLGQALAEAGKEQQAADRLAEAVAIDPEDPILRQLLGAVLADLQQTDRAIVELEKALELVASPDVHVLLGNLLVDKGRGEDGIKHYREALVLAPEDTDAHYNLGVVLGKQGRQAEAEAHYRAVLRVDGAHAEAANNLGVALLLQKKGGESIEYFERALRLDPGDGQARRNLAMALVGEKRTKDAVDVLQAGLERDPKDPELANYLAWIRATSADPAARNGAEAVRWAEAACAATGNNNPHYLDTLAAAYAEAGRFEDAVRTERRAVELAAGDPAIAAEFQPRLAMYESGKAYRQE
jgi:Flp pilus assembly protein TadD